MLSILKETFRGFARDDCGTRAAALAYYTIFALPPLLIILVTVGGHVWSADNIQTALEGEFAKVVGRDGAKQVHEMIEHGVRVHGGVVAGAIGIAGLLIGAVGAFLSLQDALNHAWEVEPDPKHGGIRSFIGKRLLSLGMILGLGFLLAVSLALSAAISSLTTSWTGAAVPIVAYTADLTISLVVLTLLFAALFNFLPDADIEWRDVWVGAAATAALFVFGKFVIGLYLGRSRPGSPFGAASALAVILVWVYYAGLILLLGAEFTQEWAKAHGRAVRPSKGAVRMIEREETFDGNVGDVDSGGSRST